LKTRWAERVGLAWDIAVVLRRVPHYRGRGQKLTFDDKMALARTILDHLRISGATLTPAPPLEGHGRASAGRDEHR